MVPGYVKDHCDSVIIGDAELSYPELLSDYEGTGTIKPVYDKQLASLKGLRLPRYELLLEKSIGYMLPVQAGRGCMHSCSFCSIACIYRGKYLVRPVEEVMRDIEQIKRLGYRRFYLIDDNIVSDPDYLIDLTFRIKPMKMFWASQCTIKIAENDKLLKAIRDSGCRILSLGIESLSQDGLDKLNKSWVRADQTEKLLKKIQRAGILPATEMIIGTDGDTPGSIEETTRFVMRCRIPAPKFYLLTPIPGTGFYHQLKAEGRLLHEDYSLYNATKCVYTPAHFSPEELDESFWRLYRKTYSLKNILKRTLFNPNFFKSPLVYMFTFYANLVYRKFISNYDSPNIL